jgi:hypothetical protein
MKEIVLRRPRLTSRSVRRGVTLGSAVAIAAVLLGGCVTPSPSTALVASTMSCQDVTVALANAESRLREARALVADAGTPAEKEKADKVASASADVDRLTADKAKTCEAGATNTATASPSATATASPTLTCTNWAWSPEQRTDFSWISGGLASIREAKTDEDAAKAMSEWMGKVQLDPVLLQGAIKLILGKDVQLADLGNGTCANDQAKQYIVQMYMLLGKARITPDQAPANGVNSGVVNGQVYSSGQPTISGDRKAIRLEIYVDGKLDRVVWILGRCGNGVTTVRIYLVTNPAEVCESGPDQGQPVGEDGTCQKDPGADPQSRGSVPAPAVKRTPSVDNSTEVGQPAEAPVDSGNGIPPGSTTPTPAPSPTHAGGPVIPSPTEPPAPLPTTQPVQTPSISSPPPPA